MSPVTIELMRVPDTHIEKRNDELLVRTSINSVFSREVYDAYRSINEKNPLTIVTHQFGGPSKSRNMIYRSKWTIDMCCIYFEEASFDSGNNIFTIGPEVLPATHLRLIISLRRMVALHWGGNAIIFLHGKRKFERNDEVIVAEFKLDDDKTRKHAFVSEEDVYLYGAFLVIDGTQLEGLEIQRMTLRYAYRDTYYSHWANTWHKFSDVIFFNSSSVKDRKKKLLKDIADGSDTIRNLEEIMELIR
jgi:hypothetical protein